MTVVKVTLPANTPADVVDCISVTILDHAIDRQPRGTYLEGIDKTQRDVMVLTFTS